MGAKKQAWDSELLLAIYRAARELPPSAFHDAALELVRGCIAFDSATWGVGFVNAAGLVVEEAHLYREVPGRYIGYEEVRGDDTVAFEVVRQPGVTRNFHMPTLYASPAKRGMREYVQRIRHFNGLVTVSADATERSARWLALYRADADAQFTERERSQCEALVPHLMEAAVSNALLQPRPRSPAKGGRALADVAGFVHHMDSAFVELVREEWPDWEERTVPVELAGALERSVFYRGERVFMDIERSGFFAMLRARRTQAVDNLSVRELHIAERIAAGQTHKEIAGALGLSPATVRNHTQRIHEKLAVRTNAELAAHLAKRAA